MHFADKILMVIGMPLCVIKLLGAHHFELHLHFTHVEFGEVILLRATDELWVAGVISKDGSGPQSHLSDFAIRQLAGTTLVNSGSLSVRAICGSYQVSVLPDALSVVPIFKDLSGALRKRTRGSIAEKSVSSRGNSLGPSASSAGSVFAT